MNTRRSGPNAKLETDKGDGEGQEIEKFSTEALGFHDFPNLKLKIRTQF